MNLLQANEAVVNENLHTIIFQLDQDLRISATVLFADLVYKYE